MPHRRSKPFCRTAESSGRRAGRGREAPAPESCPPKDHAALSLVCQCARAGLCRALKKNRRQAAQHGRPAKHVRTATSKGKGGARFGERPVDQCREPDQRLPEETDANAYFSSIGLKRTASELGRRRRWSQQGRLARAELERRRSARRLLPREPVASACCAGRALELRRLLEALGRSGAVLRLTLVRAVDVPRCASGNLAAATG